MILLTKGATHKLQLVTDAAGDIEIDLAYVDKTGTGPASYSFAGAGEPLASITTAATTDLLTGATSTERCLRRLSAYNNHASQAVTCTLQVVDGTDTVTLSKVVLAAGESLLVDAAGVITHYDPNGGPYVGVGPAATQGDMETATATNKVVTPGVVHFHPGVAKCWWRVTVSGGTPTLANSYNITSITDTATGQLTVTINVDFSGVNYACVTGVERAATALTVANCRVDMIRNATPAAGSIIHECHDLTATTTLAADPATWYGACFGDI